MKSITVALLLLLPFAGSPAQQKSPAEHSSAPTATLENRVNKAWADFKNKDKSGFASILADGFREVEDDGNGFRDGKAEVGEIDEFAITDYALKDFSVKSLAPNAALVNYIAEYNGSAGGEKVHEKDAYGEVWIKQAGNWKVLYVQSTKVK